MGDYLPSAVMQLYINNNENEFFTEQPEITFFKKTYINQDVFIKDEMVLKDVPVNWDDSYYLKIPRDIHMLGKVWVNVTIPYFQIIKKSTSQETTTTNNANLNETLYDNHNTYLINYNNLWYLIPDIFLQLPNLMYTTMQLHFYQIKDYFIPLTGVNLNNDTYVILFSFNVNNYYASDIIPLMLNMAPSYDKIILDKIMNTNERYKKNMLTQNSFDNYITKKTENILIDNYQNIKNYDQSIDSKMFNIMATEFNVLYNNRNIPDSDIAKTQTYIDSNINLTDSDIIIKENTILDNSLVLKLLISMMNPDSINTYQFYKKYAVFKIDSFYNFSITDANLVSGTIITSFPTYTVNIASLNLPFTLNTTMTFTTDDNRSITFTEPNVFTIISTETTTTLSKINIIINTNNNTYNTVNISAQYSDTNKNNQWSDNLLNYMEQLNYNESFNNYLFSDFVKNYNLKENIIINNFITLNESNEDITNLWIELKTIEYQFNKLESEILFNNFNFISAKDIIANQYKYILNIETDPQDFTNIYAVIMNKFVDIIKNKYFRDEGFIRLFYNKINSLIYMKHISIDSTPSLLNFNGLLFYYNIDMSYYITKKQIRDSLTELFNMNSFIAFIPEVLTELDLSKKDINEFQINNNIDNSGYFNELMFENYYYYSNSTIGKVFFTISGTFINISKNVCNYLFYRTNLVELIITVNDIQYPVTSYIIDDNYVKMNIDVNLGNNVIEIFLKEIIKQSIPCISISEIGNNNAFVKIPIFDKESNSDMMINYYTINTVFISQYFTLDSYESYTYYKYYFIYTINGKNTIIKGEYSGSNGMFQITLPTDYKSYDTIELVIFKLPIKNVDMDSSDFYEPIESTFPYIKLSKSSDIYTSLSSYFTNNNTFYSISNSAPMIISSVTVNYVEFYIYSQTYTSSTSYTFTIYDNSTLPNFLNYCSYDSDVSCLMDYYLQKPMIIKLNSDNENAYIMMNMPKMLDQYYLDGTKFKIYINKKQIYNIYDISNNSIIRDTITNKNYSTFYNMSTLIDSKNINTINNTVVSIYDELFTGIYMDVIDMIENSQLEYYKSYSMIINNIASKIYGITTNLTYMNCLNLNKFKLISNLSEYNIDINDINLTNFDTYDILAPSLYTFTNINRQTLNVDAKLITTLINKYFNTPKYFINLPWFNFKPYIKVNPIVYQYLDKYNNYAQIMMNEIKNNLSLIQVTNNANFEQSYGEEYTMKDKYELLVNNIEKNKVILLNHQAWDYVTTVDSPIYTIFKKDGHILNYDIFADSNLEYITEGLGQYKYKPLYDEVNYENEYMYKLIGAIKIKNNLLDKGGESLPYYLVTDNMRVICTDITNDNYFGELEGNYYGINYNCLALTTGTIINTFTLTKMTLPLYQYHVILDDMSIFNISDKYMVLIGSTLGYMTYNDTYLMILANNSILFDNNTTLYYNTTTDTNSQIFYNLQNNTTFILINNVVINNFTINKASKYNFYYNDLSWSVDHFVMLNEGILINQLYDSHIYILDNLMIYSEIQYDFTCSIFNVTKSEIMAPVNIEKTNISYYNTLNEIEWINNKNGWININNTDIMIKDFDNINIPNGNYLLYYGESPIKPTVYKYPDIYTTSKKYNNIEYNVYLNSYIFNEPLISDNIDLYTINGVKIHMIDGLYVYMEPFYNSFITTITVSNGTNNYIRPFYISTVPMNVDYYVTEEDGTPIDSMIYITNPPPSTVMTFFINFTSPQENAISYSNNITLVKVTDYRYAILIITSLPNIALDIFNMIEILTSGERIILWLYKGTYGNFNIVSNAPYYMSPGDVYLREPFYIDNSTLFDFYPLEPSFSIVDANPKYFTLDSPKITILPNTVISITLRFDSRLNFDEAKSLTGLSAYNIEDKNIQGELNIWTYIDHLQIKNNIIETDKLYNINYIIIVQDDELYFNIKKQNLNNGIELTYDITIREGDIFIYPYLPIFIKCDYSYEVRDVTIYIYSNTNTFQRNEIVMIGDLIIQIQYWSYFYSCFIGTIISNNLKKNNNMVGYYSFGIFNNYLNRNKLLKGTINYDLNLFYGDKLRTQINVGDYYIENNNLYQSTISSNNNYAFYMKSGCTTTMFYLDNKWYFDNTLILLEPYMTVIYMDNVMIVKSIDGDIVTFLNNIIPTDEKNIIYIPYQPFPVMTLEIINKEIINYKYTGWFEFYYEGNLTIYRVEEGLIIGDIPEKLQYADYTGRIINPADMKIKHDFHNIVYIDNPELQLSQNNNITPLLFDCTIYTDDTYIYIRNITWYLSYNFSNLKYCYYQSILIDNIWYQIIDIKDVEFNVDSRIYINVKSIDNPFTNTTVKVYISAGNVNDYNIISNNYKLTYSNKLEYPSITPNIINGVYGDKVYNTTVVMSGIDTYLTRILDDVYIELNSGETSIMGLDSFKSNEFFSTIINYDFFPDISKYYYFENYLPLDINITNRTFKILEFYIKLGNKILLQEITIDGAIYQHYINISIVNFILKITSNNKFHNIKTSFFYINNTIPCIITNNMYIQIIHPEYKLSRTLNRTDKNIVDIDVFVHTQMKSSPIRTGGKWKYTIEFTNLIETDETQQSIYNKIKHRNIYINNILVLLSTNNDKYYITSTELYNSIDLLYIYDSAYIDRIIITTETPKNEYINFDKVLFDDLMNVDNNISIKHISMIGMYNLNNTTAIYFNDNNSNKIIFNELPTMSYIGYSNYIISNSINDDIYLLTTQDTVIDITSTPINYNYSVNYNYKNDNTYQYTSELSLTLPSFKTYIIDNSINMNMILNINKPWRDWTLITTRHDDNLKVYLNNYDLVYDNGEFKTIQSTSYFTNNEITELKEFMKFINDNMTAYMIMNELYNVENFILKQLVYYVDQKYFWDNIINILKNIAEQYIGTYQWTIENNLVVILNEFTLYPDNFIKNDNAYVRKNYLNREFNLIFEFNYLKISRNPSIIDTNIGYIVNKTNDYNMYGTRMDNVIATLLNYNNSLNNLTPILPINFKYMDSIKYFTAKLYYDMIKDDKQNQNFNILTKMDRIIKFSDNIYYGKYFDYLFNERYYGYFGLQQYNITSNIINNSETDSVYVRGYIVGNLYNKSVPDTDINLLKTNNIFKYNIIINNKNYHSNEIIKTTNQYTVDIRDNYNHIIDPLVEDAYINTDSIIFDSSEMVQSSNISLLAKEQYSIITNIYYGDMYDVRYDSTVNSNNTLIFNNIKLLCLNETTFVSPVDIKPESVIEVILTVVITSTLVSLNRTYIILSSNYTNEYPYIKINNIVYEILQDADKFYIDEKINIKSNELYNAIKFITLTYSMPLLNKKVVDVVLDRNILPLQYNQIDNTLPQSFTMDNVIIYDAIIFTENTLRLYYNYPEGYSKLPSTIYHNYRIRESIPYEIETITELLQYYYTIPNKYNLTINDMILFNDKEIKAVMHKIINNNIIFYLTNYYTNEDLNALNMFSMKYFNLNIIRYSGDVIYATIPENLVNDENTFELVEENGNVIPVQVSFTTYMVILLPYPIISTNNLKLRQVILTPDNDAYENVNNHAFLVTTKNDTSHSNISEYFVPTIQILSNDLKEFNALYYYLIDTLLITFDYNDLIYILYNDNYIPATVYLVQKYFIIVGTNKYIPEQYVNIYDKYLTQTSNNIYLNETNYFYVQGEILEIYSNNEYVIILPRNSIQTYTKYNNTTTNKVILSFAYSKIDIKNISYEVGFKKIPDTIITTKSNNTTYQDVEWIEYIARSMFKSIEFSIDDNIIDKLDIDAFTIYATYYINMFKRDELINLQKIRINPDGSFFFNMIIPLSFTTSTGRHLPVSSMSNSNVKIKFTLNNIDSLITNKMNGYTKNVTPLIDFYYSFMTLDNNLLKEFKNYTMMLRPLYSYQYFLLNKPEEYNHLTLLNRTTDIFFITKTINNEQPGNITTVRDEWYSEYLSDADCDNYIYTIIDAEIASNSYRYKLLKNHPIIGKYDTRFAMYLDQKYLQYIDENLNNTNLKFSNKLTLLTLYFTNIYMNKNVKTNIDAIESLNILVNGKELQPKLYAEFNNMVVPYMKGYVLPDGYHLYSFAYDSLSSQPNGFAFMKRLKDFLIYSKQNNIMNEYKMKICTKEYKFIKIENNKAVML
jgi:hypothetical protein